MAICWLIVTIQAAKYYTSVGSTMNDMNIHYTNVLSNFKIEWDTYGELKKDDDPNVPVLDDKDNDSKVIKGVSIFNNCLYSTNGSRGPLVYVPR